MPQAPRLTALLARLGAPQDEPGDVRSLSMPHERAWASALGLAAADGTVPLAAWEALQRGLPGHEAGWAWITLTHWRMGTDHARMALPQELPLDEAESRALLAAMTPYFQEDGLALHYVAPQRWLAQGPLFRDLATASLDRAAGRVLTTWMPEGDAARPLRRLQQEMQMLLYTLPLNEARQQRGQLPVNSFWASGTGTLPADAGAKTSPRMVDTLREPALAGDAQAWAAAWPAVERDTLPALEQALAEGAAVRVTLCGERGARTWDSRQAGGLRRLRALFGAPPLAKLVEGL
ncbi:phosphoglycerate mutase [Ramlibacter sp.]|uniref:phosphoglycerate mutase n=1 Tax=Ramlibacter sp. TaxID=1917967 RepID=UPI0035AE18E8